MKAMWVALGAAIVSLALSGGASALGQSSYTADEQTLCQPDVFRLCNDAVPDEDRILQCMKAKRKELSAECRKAFDAGLKRRAK